MRNKILELHKAGKGPKEISEIMNCKVSTVWYYTSPGAREKILARNAKNRKKNKADLKQEYGMKCICCGYNRSSRALHFHHLDESTKIMDVATFIKRGQMKGAIEEAKKCILVCANCHAEIHDGIREAPKINFVLTEQ